MTDKAPRTWQPTISSGIFHDIDDFAGAITGWDTEFRQLEAGRPEIQMEVIASQSTVIQRFRISHSVHQQGATPSGMSTFGLLDDRSRLSWSGNDIQHEAMLDFNDPSGFECVSRARFSGCAVSFSDEMLRSLAEQLKLSTTHIVGNNRPSLHSTQTQLLDHYKKYLHNVFNYLSDDSELLDSPWIRETLDSELPFRLLTTLAESEQELCGQDLTARQKGLRKATAFIEANGYDNPRIPDVSTAAGIGWRSLDRAFKEGFGISPKRYLLNFRLIRVRRQLKDAPPSTKVVHVANDWGFWHMGDFAREYRKMFGESPSQSLPR